MAEDPDVPPASDDDLVQNFLDVKWRDATRAAREGMGHLRDLWPELIEHIPETGSNQLKLALGDMEAAYAHLHRAGKHVLGQAAYDEYVEAQTRRQVGG